MAKPTKQKALTREAHAQASGATADPRFSNFHTDPRFRLPRRNDSRIKLDKRFAHMLQDDDFIKKAMVDRYGRKLREDAGKRELARLYQADEDALDLDDEVEKELERVERRHDPARDGGFLESSSEEEDSEEDDGGVRLDGDLEIVKAPSQVAFGGSGAADHDVPVGEVSERIAVVNLDWDNIRAIDIMAVASSFCPPDGKIESVSVYPSEFGRQRMDREELEGPAPELFTSTNPRLTPPASSAESGEDEDTDEKIKSKLLRDSTASDGDVDSHALRTYQLSRLRYYYAVITCNSSSTGLALYTAMDGREYLTTSNFFDMRFIPEGVTFDDPITDKPRDTCNSVPEGYRPNEFITEALTHSKVRLTWDEEDRERKEMQKRAFSRAEIEENDLKAYVGGDSDDDAFDQASDPGTTQNRTEVTVAQPSNVDMARQRVRALLGISDDPVSSETKEETAGVRDLVGPVQITFSAGLTSKPSNSRNSVLGSEQRDVKEETTQEKYVRKEKERKERRRSRAKARREGNEVGIEDAEERAKLLVSAKTTEDNIKDDFDDPFFEDPATANAAARKDARRAKKASAEAEAEASAARKQKERDELELLMAGDETASHLGARHFDMADIKKAEKEKAKKGKKKNQKDKKSASASNEKNDGETADFKVDFNDPRFANLYGSHEFAIDPSNPRFSGTEGMKRILEEGRRKRQNESVEKEPRHLQDEDRNNHGRRKVDDSDLTELVTRVKRRKIDRIV